MLDRISIQFIHHLLSFLEVHDIFQLRIITKWFVEYIEQVGQIDDVNRRLEFSVDTIRGHRCIYCAFLFKTDDEFKAHINIYPYHKIKPLIYVHNDTVFFMRAQQDRYSYSVDRDQLTDIYSAKEVEFHTLYGILHYKVETRACNLNSHGINMPHLYFGKNQTVYIIRNWLFLEFYLGTDRNGAFILAPILSYRILKKSTALRPVPAAFLMRIGFSFKKWRNVGQKCVELTQ